MGMINPACIPEHIAILEAGNIEQLVTAYFKDPVHQKEFRRWKRERRKQRKHEKVDVAGSVDCGSVEHSDPCMALRA